MRIFHHNNKSSWYHEIFYEKADPRIRDRWLMGDPLQMILIYGFYVLLIMYILPRFMRDRKPFDVDKPLIVLNTLVFIVSTYFVIKGFVPWFFIFNWRCEPIDYTDSDLAMRAVDASHLFLVSKFLYIFESIFVGLRKNYSYRATYLLIHHSTFPFVIWAIVNYFPGGHATFAGFANSLIHMLLFGYRLLFVDIKPNLWPLMYKYKKPVGLWLSILQFLLIFIHTFQLFFWNDCGFPMTFVYIVSIYVTFISILMLFMVVPHM